jgi:AraC-like DNA-binding protein
MIFLAPSVIAEMLSMPESALEIQFPVAADTELRDLLIDTFHALIDSDENLAEQSLALLLERTFSTTRASPKDASRTYSAGVQAVVERIADVPASPPSLVEVSELMKMTKTAALRRFTRETGITPYAYAQQYRVRLARRQISTGSPIRDVALGLGFADQSHLTRAFKKQFGAPPGHWRTRKSNIVQD